MLNSPKKLITFLLFVSFIEGAAVMAIEILGAKLIAPFYGSSLYVWSATLAITLSALACGYFIGAIISAKTKELNNLFFILLGAGILIGLMNYLSFWIMTETINLDIKTGSVLSLLVFMFLPLVFLGTTSPIIINHLSSYDNRAGRNSGMVYSISTVGGIISSFWIGFYAITSFGVKATCVYTSILVLILPLLFFILKKKTKTITITLICLGVTLLINKSVLFEPLQSKSSIVKLLYKNDGLLGTLCVFDIEKDNRMLSVNNTGQTAYHIPTKKALWEYVHRIATYSSLKPNGSKALICGLGGGVLANEFEDLGFKVDACDFDERMEYVAKKYFNLSNNVNVYIDDARHFIKTTKNKYDIVVLDLSFGENVPANVFTKECFNELKALLNPQAFIFVHYVDNGSEGNSKSIKAIAKTFSVSGYNVKLLNTTTTNTNSKENMFFATIEDINLELLTYNRTPAFSDTIFSIPKNKNVYSNLDFSNGITLTDDKPIFEILHNTTALKMRSANIKNKESIIQNSFLY